MKWSKLSCVVFTLYQKGSCVLSVLIIFIHLLIWSLSLGEKEHFLIFR